MTIEVCIPEIPWETTADGSLQATVAGIGCYVDRTPRGRFTPRCGNAVLLRRSEDGGPFGSRYWDSMDDAKDAVHRHLIAKVHSAVHQYLPHLKTITAVDALQAIADLPTGENESVMQGHEEAYRAIEALFDKPPTITRTE